jgi:hypothetical protein
VIRLVGLLLACCALSSGCVRAIAINTAADALSGSGGGFATDDDPELIRDAAPFGLKTTESLIEAAPVHAKLLLAACSGFTQYAYAFVQQDAERLDEKDPDRAKQLLARARRLYARARRYGMRGLDAEVDGFSADFAKDRAAAVARCGTDEVPLLYWTAAAWGAQIAISKNDARLLGDQPEVEALMTRALALDEAWGAGSIHEFFVSWEAAKSDRDHVARAKRHFDRAIAIARGRKLAPYVAWAEGIDVQQQNKKEFIAMLDKAIAFDCDEAPEFRLANLITQDRARRLRARVEDLFAD